MTQRLCSMGCFQVNGVAASEMSFVPFNLFKYVLLCLSNIKYMFNIENFMYLCVCENERAQNASFLR